MVQPQLNRGPPSPQSRFSWGLTAAEPRLNLGSAAVKPRFNRGLTLVLLRFTAVFVRLFLDSTVSLFSMSLIISFIAAIKVLFLERVFLKHRRQVFV